MKLQICFSSCSVLSQHCAPVDNTTSVMCPDYCCLTHKHTHTPCSFKALHNWGVHLCPSDIDFSSRCHGASVRWHLFPCLTWPPSSSDRGHWRESEGWTTCGAQPAVSPHLDTSVAHTLCSGNPAPDSVKIHCFCELKPLKIWFQILIIVYH